MKKIYKRALPLLAAAFLAGDAMWPAAAVWAQNNGATPPVISTTPAENTPTENTPTENTPAENTPAAVITDVQIEPYQGTYDKTEHPLVTVKNTKDGDKISYELGGVSSEEVPMRKDAGTYRITVTVTRQGYETLTRQIEAKIEKASFQVPTIKGVSVPEDGEEHNAVEVSGKPDDVVLRYKLDGGEWQAGIPQIRAWKNGGYEVEVLISKAEDIANYVSVENVKVQSYITKKQTMHFKEAKIEQKKDQFYEVTLQTDPNQNRHNVAVEVEGVTDPTVQYSLEELSEPDMAEIDQTGQLTVKKPGVLTVVATGKQGLWYQETVRKQTIAVKPREAASLRVAKQAIDYTLDEAGIASDQKAEKTDPSVPGQIQYSLAETELGLSIDPQSGQVKVADRAVLFKYMKEGGVITTKVTAALSGELSGVKLWKETSGRYEETKHHLYERAEAEYQLKVQYDRNLPENTWTVNQPAETGWYNAANHAVVTTADAAKYEIALNDPSGQFQTTIEVTKQGEATHYIYTKDKTTGRIGFGKRLKLKVDYEKPKAEGIEYQELISRQFDPVYYFNPNVLVLFQASDEGGSGLHHTEWSYRREEQAPLQNLEQDGGTLANTTDTAEMTLEATKAKQYRGKLAFCAVDQAGNRSDWFHETKTLIGDSLAPQGTFTYSPAVYENSQVAYYKDQAEAKLLIEELNFQQEDVLLTLARDDRAASAVDGASLTWTALEPHKHQLRLPLTEEGSYRYQVDYTDRAQNKMQPLASKRLVLDQTAPARSADYAPAQHAAGGARFYAAGQVSMKLVINEANFYAEDVVLEVEKDGRLLADPSVEWSHSGDRHTANVTLTGEGSYIVRARYTDRSGNQMPAFVSETMILDTTAPQISVQYRNNDRKNSLPDRTGAGRDYFATAQVADITIRERNFNAEEAQLAITATDVSGAALNVSNLVHFGDWSHDGDLHRISVTFAGEANYLFDVEYHDLATNAAADYPAYAFTVDSSAPQITSVSYSPSVANHQLPEGLFRFYQNMVTVTVAATDSTSGVHAFDVSSLRAAGVSPVNEETIQRSIQAAQIRFSEDGRVAAIQFDVPADSVKQFNGTISLTATDRSGNRTQHSGQDRLVVDSLTPKMQISYNEPIKQAQDISYYDQSIQCTITVTEANFDANDMEVTAIFNGQEQKIKPTWNSVNTDRHIGSFALSADGAYEVKVTYSDKSGNQMLPYHSSKMVVDTELSEPVFYINGQQKHNGQGGAYKEEAIIKYQMRDPNYEMGQVKLIKTGFRKHEDVTERYIKSSAIEQGEEGSFEIPKDAEHDGIYILTVTAADKAGHKKTAELKFTINRYGSVYEYSDYLRSLIANGGRYLKKDGDTILKEDLLITEYNPDKLTRDSLRIHISRDGEPVDSKFTSTPAVIDERSTVGESGWYQYLYTISKENFMEDGYYKIVLTSKDDTGNHSTNAPTNAISREGEKILDEISFTVDTTAPEIRNISGLEQAIIDKTDLEVQYDVRDVGGLARIEVYLDDQKIDEVTTFGDAQHYQGQFHIKEGKDARRVRLVAHDKAGNITDTAKADWKQALKESGLFAFIDTVTVSTNFFVRWYANKLAFGISVGALSGVAAAGLLLLLWKRRKKNSNQ